MKDTYQPPVDSRAEQIRQEARAQHERLMKDIRETDAFYDKLEGMKPSEVREFLPVEAHAYPLRTLRTHR